MNGLWVTATVGVIHFPLKPQASCIFPRWQPTTTRGSRLMSATWYRSLRHLFPLHNFLDQAPETYINAFHISFSLGYQNIYIFLFLPKCTHEGTQGANSNEVVRECGRCLLRSLMGHLRADRAMRIGPVYTLMRISIWRPITWLLMRKKEVVEVVVYDFNWVICMISKFIWYSSKLFQL